MNIPADLSDLLQSIATDFPAILSGNLVGIYLWGSLTYDAFDETCSDVDCVGVTRRDLDDRQFSELDEWFRKKGEQNRWVKRIDMRFVIEHEFLDKASRCCGFYHYMGKLTRHGSDGNPIIWINIARSGITLWGKDAKVIAPHVSDQCLNGALLLELSYLKEDLTSNAGDRSDQAFIHNAYAVLTACRILYSALHRALASKDQAYDWAMQTVPPMWRGVIRAAKDNRLKNNGSTTPGLEQDAIHFVEFATTEVRRALKPPTATENMGSKT
ncbi:MAG: aminoglycoside adenylyltransferase domain-containing protein [Candidatus Sulfotelmatobacter sp.]